MAGMKRFVTYIYSYEEKKKSRNSGFAKIEIRGEQGRIEVHLRGAYPGKMTAQVYLFVEDEGDMAGVLLGGMKVQNGSGDFSVVFKVENVVDSALNFFSFDGIAIIGEEQHMFMSRWKEGRALEVCADRFHILKKEEVRKDIAEEKIINEKRNHETAQEVSVQEKSIEQVEKENLVATELPMRNIFPHFNWEEIWERLKQNREEIVLGKEKEISIVKIELKDIRELPRRYWYLGNNSFLLHGFFNYHYLIIGKIGKDRWVLGVPGIYQNQERVMAVIFGFPEFMMEPIENQFGYWYRVLEE